MNADLFSDSNNTIEPQNSVLSSVDFDRTITVKDTDPDALGRDFGHLN